MDLIQIWNMSVILFSSQISKVFLLAQTKVKIFHICVQRGNAKIIILIYAKTPLSTEQ